MYRQTIRIMFPFIATLLLFMTGCSHKSTPYQYLSATQHTTTARHKSTMKPYVVKYKRYTPHLVQRGTKQYGISSWYGPNFHGKYTSNGEIYNMHAHTAAHKTFPMDTIVRVTNRENGKSTVVRINDRGPFVSGRIIDCSYCAGKELGLDKMGIAKVEVEVLGMAKLNQHKQAIIQKRKQLPQRSYHSTKVLGVQLGAYRSLSGAYACQKRYTNRYAGYRPVIKRVMDTHGVALYRVWLLGFKSRSELESFKRRQNQFAERI